MLHATYSGAKQYSTAATEPRVAAVQLLQVKLFAGKWGSATSQIRAMPAGAQIALVIGVTAPLTQAAPEP